MSALDPGYVCVGKTGNSINAAGATQPASGATATLWDSTKRDGVNATSDNRGLYAKALIINIESSHDSAANGLVIAESDDGGANWSTVYSRTYTQAVDGRLKVIYKLVGAPEIWVTYENSANTLTTFRWSVLIDERERG